MTWASQRHKAENGLRLDEQEIPASNLHHVPPVDVRRRSLRFRARGAGRADFRKAVVLAPNFAEEGSHAAKGAAVGKVTKGADALLGVRAECAAGSAHGAADEVDPDQAAVKARGTRGDALEDAGQLVQKVHRRRLAGAEAGNQAAEVNASRQAESAGDVLGQLLGRQRAVLGVWGARSFLVDLGHADLLAQRRHVLAKHKVVHAAGLERFEACNLRDEVHDAVVAAHELAKPKVGVLRQVLLAVGVSKHRRGALHGRAENVNPRSQRHVEGGLNSWRSRLSDDARQVELLHEADGSLEVLVPRDIKKGIARAADEGREKDEAEGSLEDLLVVFIVLQSLAQAPDGSVAVAHDVLVHRTVGVVVLHLEVLGGNAQAAVQVDAVGLEGGEDKVAANRTVLVGPEDREDVGHNSLDEVIQQALVILLKLDANLARILGRAVGKVKEVDVERLLSKGLLAVLVELLGPRAWERTIRQNSAGGGRGLEGAEGGDVRLAQGGHVVDKHLALRLDIHLVRGVSIVHELWRHVRAVGREFAGGAVEVEGGGVRINGHGAVAAVRVSGRSRLGVRQVRRRAGRALQSVCSLFRELLALDNVLDLFLLVAASFVVCPPHRSLVFALEPERLAGGAEPVELIALLSS